ncbi:RNA methyltransferase [Lactobacillus agilis]|uniref:RNA methyltransferase n=1 Tax=Ligilactobacillus agilis TaxID=1601 RepID=A0A6F9YKY3_9LACO|nr:RsmB/NOP family class I SAM-dependent RNA methyltransferase [Ligilactobacillus agilis]NME41793.1 RNA methyltransferase [Ligilactobacillus agilis]GET18152.1 23S rRNA methyltransferase [Ligilactobacillus agilis]
MELPKDFISKYQRLLATEAEEFLAAFDGPVEKGFRLNPLKENYQAVAYSLAKKAPHVKTGYYGEVSGRSLDHQAGYVYSQDLSAMYVAEVADAKPGEWILDLCAAPGGKSTQLVEAMANQGLLVANEINKKRAAILAENLERSGASNYIVLNESPQNLAKNWGPIFDKIVVDAPCSGEGMFRKDHQATSYWDKDYPAECAKRQKEILKSALELLKPGGKLIYSTCTFAPEEDEQIVAWLLAEYPDLRVLPIKQYPGMDQGRPNWADGNPDLEKTIRLFPHHFKGEGHFVALLEKVGQAVPKKVSKKKGKAKQAKGNLSLEQLELWQAFSQELVGTDLFASADLKLVGDYLYYSPKTWPRLANLRYLRPGLLLGVFKKKRFEPSYTLALALKPSQVKRVLAVSESEWENYVKGNVLTTTSSQQNGWYLLTCQQKGFAFGKKVNQQIKNFFPKALRFY